LAHGGGLFFGKKTKVKILEGETRGEWNQIFKKSKVGSDTKRGQSQCSWGVLFKGKTRGTVRVGRGQGVHLDKKSRDKWNSKKG